MPKQKQNKETLIVRVTVGDDEFQKYERETPRPDAPVRADAAAPGDPAAREAGPSGNGDAPGQADRSALDALAELFDPASFADEHPEIVAALAEKSRKLGGQLRSGWARTAAWMERDPSGPSGSGGPFDGGGDGDAAEVEVVYDVGVMCRDGTRIALPDEKAAQLLGRMREKAEGLAAMMHAWAEIAEKEEKSEGERLLDELCRKHLLTDDVRRSVETLVTNRHLLDPGTAKTLAAFLDGNLIGVGRQFPIPD